MEQINSQQQNQPGATFLTEIYINKILPYLGGVAIDSPMVAVGNAIDVYKGLFGQQVNSGALEGLNELLNRAKISEIRQDFTNLETSDGLAVLEVPQFIPGAGLLHHELAYCILSGANFKNVRQLYNELLQRFGQSKISQIETDEVDLLYPLRKQMFEYAINTLPLNQFPDISLQASLNLIIPENHALRSEFLSTAIGHLSEPQSLSKAIDAVKELQQIFENEKWNLDLKESHRISLRWGLARLSQLILKVSNGSEVSNALKYVNQIDHNYFRTRALINLLSLVETKQSSIDEVTDRIVAELNNYPLESNSDHVNHMKLQLACVEDLLNLDESKAKLLFENLCSNERLSYLLGSEEGMYSFLKIASKLGKPVTDLIQEVEKELLGYSLYEGQLGQFKFIIKTDFLKAKEMIENFSDFIPIVAQAKFLTAYAKTLINQGMGHEFLSGQGWFTKLPETNQINLYALCMFNLVERGEIDSAKNLLKLIPAKDLIDFIRTM